MAQHHINMENKNNMAKTKARGRHKKTPEFKTEDKTEITKRRGDNNTR